MINDPTLIRFLSDPYYGYPEHINKKSEISDRTDDFRILCGISNEIEKISDPYRASHVAISLAKKHKISNVMNIINTRYIEEDTFEKSKVKDIENKVSFNIEKSLNFPVECCTPMCTNRAIGKSHSIQRIGIISTISDSSNSVYQTKSMPFAGANFLKKVGWKNASVFPGYCSDCENHMFKSSEVEDPPLTREVLGKLIWRALCFTRYRRAIEIKERASIVSKPDAYNIGADFDNMMVPLSSALILKTRIAAFRNINNWITDFERSNFGERNKFEFIAIEINHAPFLAAGVIPVHYDFNGKKIQSAGNFYKPIQQMVVTPFVTGSKRYFLLCYKKSEKKSVEIINQLLKLDYDLLSAFLPQMIVGNCDTVYISPKWWNEDANVLDKHIILHSFLMNISFMVFPWWGGIKGMTVKSVSRI